MRLSNSLAPCLAVAAVFLSAPATGAVTESASGGFVVRIQQSVVAPRATVWRMLTGHVAEWWNGDHTYSGSAANMFIEARPLGCFCETLGDGGAVVHMTVTMINPGRLLRLTGGLGPIGLMGAEGNMVFSLVDDGDNTQLTLEYRVGGFHPEGLDTIAPAVDGVLTEQVQRLVTFVESGTPQSPVAPKRDQEVAPADPAPDDPESDPAPADDADTPEDDARPAETRLPRSAPKRV